MCRPSYIMQRDFVGDGEPWSYPERGSTRISSGVRMLPQVQNRPVRESPGSLCHLQEGVTAWGGAGAQEGQRHCLVVGLRLHTCSQAEEPWAEKSLGSYFDGWLGAGLLAWGQ